jgi:DNA mismatch repair ATPase MutS
MLKVKERTQQEIRNQIAEIVKAEGYNAMAEEIKNDRRPKANIKGFIKSRYNSKLSALTAAEEETKKTVEKLNKKVKPNSPEKLKFFEVLNEYSNNHAEYWKVAIEMDNLKGKNWEKWEKLYKRSNELFQKSMELEYKLGNFIK